MIKKTIILTGLILGIIGCGERPSFLNSVNDSSHKDDVSVEVNSSISVGAFNMLRLGHGTKDMDRLVELIVDANFDIFAGVEIMTEEGATELLYGLNAATRHKWKMALSSVATGESTYKELFAYYYRPDKVKPVVREESFCARRSATFRTGAVCFARDWRADGDPDFSRDPFVGHFKAGKTEFAFVAVHLIYGGSDVRDLKKRHEEMDRLKIVLERVKRYTPKSNVIALGDFNLLLAVDKEFTELEEELRHIPIEFFEEAPRLIGLINEPTTVGFSSYDHFIYFESNVSQVVPDSEKIIYDFQLGSYVQREKFKRDVSDHYPIKAKFTVKK